ncbi:MAG TPA: rod shape-determining protein MreD [Chloroflexi bacterium]|nr:rod shape-determining protein MreD [Chloroflexota bacterium]
MLIAGVLQSALTPFLSFHAVHPDLLLVVIVAWSMLRDLEDSLPLAFVGGALLDLLSPTPLGPFTLSMLLVSLVTGFWRDKLSYNSFLLAILLTLPYSILFYLIFLPLLWATGYPMTGLGQVFVGIIFPASLMNVGVMALVYPLFRYLDRFRQRDELTI